MKYYNPLDQLVYGLSETETPSNVGLVLGGILLLGIAVFVFYRIGKYHQTRHKLATWLDGLEMFFRNIAERQAKAQAIIPIFILQYSEVIALSDMLTCFHRPVYKTCYSDCGVCYYTFRFAGIKSDFRNRSKCILFVSNTVQRYFQEVRNFDCGGVYVKTLTATELCFGYAGNQYGVQQIAPLLEAQEHKIQRDMSKMSD